jgi:cytochrome c peroxidase
MRPRSALWAGLALLAAAGCQRAGVYVPPSAAEESPRAEALPPLSAGLQWQDPDPTLLTPTIRIEFVHAGTAPAEWAKLTRSWNIPESSPTRAAAALAGGPLCAAVVAAARTVPAIRIKVPLGLDNPAGFLPPGDPPTLAKWELGRRLFFDGAWLEDRPGTSCAGCHLPERGYTDHVQAHPGGFNAPTLVNCVYNRRQFWDGRAALLEEVVQRTLEDERPAERPTRFRHVWAGVVGRLRADRSYRIAFHEAFGTEPTQDAIGRSVANYLRTLLAGNALHDRAVQARAKRGAGAPEAQDYEGVLDDAALEQLGQKGAKKAEVAARLARGHELFHGKARCAVCHGGGQFTDGGFHNLGVGDELAQSARVGRFTMVPLGEKDRYLIGAWKTPTLRGLRRTAPYFHDGSQNSLAGVVRFHAAGGRASLFLSPLMRGPDGRPLDLGLTDDEVEALVLFLGALTGEEVDPFVKGPPPPPKK